jgi:polysaccharide export outer membrane protein
MAAGRTTEELRNDIAARLRRFVLEPQVAVAVIDLQSRPVSVFGSVARPGVIQLDGPRTLYEVISLAGGLTSDVGDTIRVTRRLEIGQLPLRNSRIDDSGKFSVGDVSVESVLNMTNPDENIVVMPRDVVTVSRADIVYVIGNVQKGGGFVTKGRISVLEALSLAGGFTEHAAAKNARILRLTPGSDKRTLLAVNLRKLLRGNAEDVVLRADDILFVPHSGMREFTSRTVSTALGIVSGVSVYRVGLDR